MNQCGGTQQRGEHGARAIRWLHGDTGADERMSRHRGGETLARRRARGALEAEAVTLAAFGFNSGFAEFAA